MVDIRLAVLAVGVLAPAGAREPAGSLVEPDRVGRHPDTFRQLADPHRRSKPWSASNVKRPRRRPRGARLDPRLEPRQLGAEAFSPSSAMSGDSSRHTPCMAMRRGIAPHDCRPAVVRGRGSRRSRTAGPSSATAGGVPAPPRRPRIRCRPESDRGPGRPTPRAPTCAPSPDRTRARLTAIQSGWRRMSAAYLQTSSAERAMSACASYLVMPVPPLHPRPAARPPAAE